MPGLSMKETRRLIEHIQPQGVVATKTKNGLLLRLPNGESTVVHYSVSDYRGPQKLRAQLRRAGVTWPTDPGKHVQKSKPSKPTIQRAQDALSRLGEPDTITTKELALAMGLDPKTSGMTARRYLSWAGWELVGATANARWIRPLPDGTVDPFPAPKPAPIVELHPAPTPEDAPEPEAPEPEAPEPEAPEPEAPEPEAPEPEAPEPEAPEPEPAAAGGREFIDTADSWTADWDAIGDDMTVGELRRMFALLRLNVELRTWRQA